MSDDSSDDKPGNDSHLRVVTFRSTADKQKTAEDDRKRACVLKLRELLAQAEQGHFIDLIVITSRNASDHTFHWTPTALGGQAVRFLGALRVMDRILVDSVKLGRS